MDPRVDQKACQIISGPPAPNDDTVLDLSRFKVQLLKELSGIPSCNYNRDDIILFKPDGTVRDKDLPIPLERADEHFGAQLLRDLRDHYPV